PVGGQVEQATQLFGNARITRSPMINRRRNDVSCDHRPAEEGALQRLAGTMQTHVPLSGREDDSDSGPHLGSPHLDVVAAGHARVDALQPIEAHEGQSLVLPIGTDGDCGGMALPDDLDDLALLEAELRERLAAEAGDTTACILRPRGGHLQRCALLLLFVGHRLSPQTRGLLLRLLDASGPGLQTARWAVCSGQARLLSGKPPRCRDEELSIRLPVLEAIGPFRGNGYS